MAESQGTGYEESQRGAWLSIVTYIILTTLKIGVGLWAGSRALVADGVNNLTDVIGSVAVLFGLRIAGQPADEEHRYGHQRAETVAAVVVASIMGLIGLDVGAGALRAAFRPDLGVPHISSLWVGLVSAVVMFLVYSYNIRLARRTGSKALAAAAYDNRSDALTAIGAGVGILGAHLGWPWLDPLAGAVVAVIIIRTAWHIGAEAAHALMDGFDAAELDRIRRLVGAVDGVREIHSLRARHLGNLVAVEVTIGVSPSLSVVEAHAVSDQVEKWLLQDAAIADVHVHTEPAGA